MKKQLLAVSLLAAISTPAMASNFYLNGNIGQSKFEVDSANKKDTAFSLGAGYKFNNYIAVELAYADFGEMSESYTEDLGDGDYYKETYSFGASALQASLVASIPLGDSVAIYGRLGIADIEFDASYKEEEVWFGEFDSYSESASQSKNKTVFGLGLSFAITQSLSLRTEYAQYDKWEGIEISTLNAGLTYQF